ncbi:UDP-glucose 4-epimerase GalE [Batrachochytrium salamandrivorans]|nr:UDP-glucose 4-epimerase GalE [Batrachochytrium salamandrivorans]
MPVSKYLLLLRLYIQQVLVCGGAGYIGSHLVREITKLPDYEVVVFDNMTKGHSVAVPAGIKLVRGDIRNQDDLESIFLSFKPDAVFFFVFSSTAALFGMPDRVPIHEFDTAVPKNPYGDTKLAVETMLKWCDEAWGLKNVCLRYFNACGADASGDIGEDHQPESHLIPIVLQVPRGMREKVFINGSDYNTPDGTCVRDYIHVTDLATAHIKALQHIVKTNTSDKFNLGSGKGYSVKEIINAARKVTGHPIPADLTDRRPGDPDTLIAASDRAETILGWKRQYNTIEEIVATAWNFHQKHPNGLDH